MLDDLGLAGGLASLARSIGQIDVKVDLAETRLPDHIELALYGSRKNACRTSSSTRARRRHG